MLISVKGISKKSFRKKNHKDLFSALQEESADDKQVQWMYIFFPIAVAINLFFICSAHLIK